MQPAEWAERFTAYVFRKTRAAIAADLPPYVTEMARPATGMVPISNGWSSHIFDGPFYISDAANARHPACSLVFVQSADGNTGTNDPEALGGGATDKHLIYEGLSRVAADAVLAGADTVRGPDLVFSVWHPELVALRQSLGRPRHPVQVVATRRGVDLDTILLFNVPEIPVVLLTVASGADPMRQAAARRPWITTVVMDSAEDLATGFEQLRRSGVRRLSCVGGHRLARQLLDAALVDDLYLTTSPRPGGEPDTPLHPQPLTGRTIVRKRGTGTETDVVFEHVARPRPSAR